MTPLGWLGRKTSNKTKILVKMAYRNSADPGQTAPAVWSGSTLFAILLSILRPNCIKKQNLGQESVE